MSKLVVRGIEVEEAPKGIKPKELEEIVIKAEGMAHWMVREYWNPLKGVYENERGERLRRASASGRLRFGPLRIFKYWIEVDPNNGGGRIRIRRVWPSPWPTLKATLASAGLGAAAFGLVRLGLEAGSEALRSCLGLLAGVILAVLGFTVFVSVESLVEWLRTEEWLW
jgi:hypothetical protein